MATNNPSTPAGGGLPRPTGPEPGSAPGYTAPGGSQPAQSGTERATRAIDPASSSSASGGTHSLAEEARQQASRIADEAEQEARATGEKVRERVMERGEEERERAVHTADSLVEAIRSAGSTLRDRDEERLGHLTDELADQVQRFSGYIRDRDVGSLFDDLQDMARRNPTAFLGSSLAAGLLAGRFLRSSGRHAHEEPGHEQGHRHSPSRQADAEVHRPPSHQEFASNSPTPELSQPREAAEGSAPARTTTFGRETTYTGGGLNP